MKTFHLIIDVAKCEDCNCCFLACKDEYVDNEWPGYSASQPLHGQRWMNVLRTERGTYPIVDVGFLPQPCMHCDAAPCVSAGRGAITKRKDGLVIIDPKKAGNKALVDACPYRAIWWNEEKKIAQKCTGCAHLLDSGWKQPRCSQACPTGALSFAYVDDLAFKKMIADEGLEAYHPEYATKPNVYYKNLHRFTKCFIGGCITTQKNGIEECVPGARVGIYSGTMKVGEAETDTFGEFKVDRLKPNSGPYRVEISANGSTQSLKVSSLPQSVNLGTIVVDQ